MSSVMAVDGDNIVCRIAATCHSASVKKEKKRETCQAMYKRPSSTCYLFLLEPSKKREAFSLLVIPFSARDQMNDDGLVL